MTEQKKEVPVERQLGEDKNQNPEHYQGDPMNTSVPTPLAFRPEIDLDSKVGGLITVAAEHVFYLGRHVVAIHGFDARISLEASEARELADMLLAIASLIDGHHVEEGVELRRSTEPGAPAFEEAI